MESGQPTAKLSLRTIVRYCLERNTLRHAIKTALVVGTILALINHGGELLTGHVGWPLVVPMLLTYLVPFFVTLNGEVHGKWQHAP